MNLVTGRLRRRIERDFPDAGSSEEVIRLVGETDLDGLLNVGPGVAGSERVHASVVLWAAGDVARLLDGIRMVRDDVRDQFVRGGLENEDWRQRLDCGLGPVVAGDWDYGHSR